MLQLVTSILLLLVDWEMDQNEKRDLLEIALQAVGQVLNEQQNHMINDGAVRPDRFSSDAFPNWVQWKLHFVAVEEANWWTQIQAINALPVCISGNALDFHAAPAELKQHFNGEPVPTLQALFEHLDRALGVLRNDRRGRSECEALLPKGGDSLRDFARKVRSSDMLVYANINAEQRDEQFRERFIEGLSNPDLLEVLLREDNRTFRKTVERVVDVEATADIIRNLPSKRMEAFRVTQEDTTTRNHSEMDEMKQQLKKMTSAMNSLTSMVNQFVGAVVSSRRCDVCREDGHSAEICKQRRNALNLRGPGGRHRN